MNVRAKKWLKFTLRWGIAVAGIFYVVKNISLHDQVIIPDAAGHPVLVRLVNTEVDEDGRSFTVLDPSQGGRVVTLERTQLLSRADRDKATIRDPRTGAPRKVDVLALKVTDHPDRSTWPLVVGEPRGLVMKYFNRWPDAPPIVVEPSAVVEPSPYRVQVPYPLIDRGLGPMVARADRTFLLAAILIFPLTYLITSYRWHVLLEALDVRMRMARAFAINMVGAFYNTFMPGSTGGDVLKAYYAAKQAPNQRTRAVMSVVVDRAIGLLALIMLGGAMAAYQFFRINNPADPTARACRQVAVGSAAILVLVVVGLSVFYHPDLKRLTGLDWLIKRLPMQKQVHKALDAMDAYRRRPVLVFWALVVSLPVHATTVVSVLFAGMALGLPLTPGFYWIVVPVCVLAGSIPISPQGAGVMEFFAILLTRRQGATIAHAFALTMSIRLVQILWNLAGGLFVFRGGYHAPTEKEERELEEEGTPTPAPAPEENTVKAG